METAIDISRISKAKVLAALYNGARPQGMGFLHFDDRDMSESEAEDILSKNPRAYFDYVKGRVMKVDLSGDQLNPRLYDRDNGHGAAASIIAGIK